MEKPTGERWRSQVFGLEMEQEVLNGGGSKAATTGGEIMREGKAPRV